MKQGNGGAGVIRAVLGFVGAMVMATAMARAVPPVLAGWGIHLPEVSAWAQPEVFAGLLILCGLFREAVHVAAALGVGFHFQELSLGPVLLTNRYGGRWRVKLTAQDVFSGGAYLQAIPETAEGLRGSLALVVMAGPVGVLLVSLLAFLTLVSIRGVEPIAAAVFCATAGDFAARVLPLGMTEGARLYHLLLQTEKGERMVKALESLMAAEETGKKESLLDPAEVLEVRRQTVEEMEKFPPASQFALMEGRLDLARAAVRSEDFEAAAGAMELVREAVNGDPDVPETMRFTYWALASQTANGQGRLNDALAAREKAIEISDAFLSRNPEWDARIPVILLLARLQMEAADYMGAVEALGRTRELTPTQRAGSGAAIEVLTLEAECEVHLRRRDAAVQKRDTAIEATRRLAERGDGSEGDGAAAIETMIRSAMRLSEAGEHGFAGPLFEAAVPALERIAPATVTARYRTAWAASFYEDGKLAEAAATVAPLSDSLLPSRPELIQLRAILLLAEERYSEATTMLTPLAGRTDEASGQEAAVAQSLRSWALFRGGEAEAGVADARQACDLLVPAEDESAAPALFTLAVAVGEANGALADAYLTEAMRLIEESSRLSRSAKSARLIDLARFAVQAGKKDWATTMIGTAQAYRQTTAA